MLTPAESARTGRAAMQPGAMLDARWRRERRGDVYSMRFRSDSARGLLFTRNGFAEWVPAVREAVEIFREARVRREFRSAA
jgi:hypothetical protein